MKNKILKCLILSVAAITLNGCLVTPDIISNVEHVKRADSDLVSLYNDVEPLNHPLTLSEAIARSLLYNFDYKMGLMEEVLQQNQLTLANFNMLPRLAANAGYGWRNTERATRSISLNSRLESLEPSFSEEPASRDADLSFSWSILDFGLSYYQAKQQADMVMSAIERRRRVMNNMVKEVQTAYWKALSAQYILPEVGKLIWQVDGAIVDLNSIEAQRLQSPLKTLEQHKGLLQIMTQLRQLQAELQIAKSHLRSLINLPATQDFTLASTGNTFSSLPATPSNIDALQSYSLIYRPELREETYQERIDEQNIKKEVIRVFPGLSLLGSTNYNANKYLAYNNWHELGVRATWNLINVLQAPTAIDAAKAQVEISKMRRLALSAAVLSQVSISYNQYIQSVEGYKTARELSIIDAKVMHFSKNSNEAQKGTKLDHIQSSAELVASRLAYNNAFAAAQEAHANLLVSVGLDLIPASKHATSLEAMNQIVKTSLDQVHNVQLDCLIGDPLETNARNNKCHYIAAPPVDSRPVDQLETNADTNLHHPRSALIIDDGPVW